jgi:hypothetical protein
LNKNIKIFNTVRITGIDVCGDMNSVVKNSTQEVGYSIE